MASADLDLLATLPKTRREILTLLKRRGRATISELAQELGMTHEGVRARVVQLQNDGLIIDNCDLPDPSGNAQPTGRPPAYYCLTTTGDHLFPKRYDVLALLGVNGVAALQDERTIEAVLANVTDARLESLQIPAKAPLRARIDALASVYLDGDPYFEAVPHGNDWILIERNCPFLNVALQRPEICSTTVSAMRRVLGCEVVRERRFQDGDGRCEFHVRTSRPIRNPPRFAPEPPKSAQ